jgi:hypothetical protein
LNNAVITSDHVLSSDLIFNEELIVKEMEGRNSDPVQGTILTIDWRDLGKP